MGLGNRHGSEKMPQNATVPRTAVDGDACVGLGMTGLWGRGDLQMFTQEMGALCSIPAWISAPFSSMAESCAKTTAAASVRP